MRYSRGLKRIPQYLILPEKKEHISTTKKFHYTPAIRSIGAKLQAGDHYIRNFIKGIFLWCIYIFNVFFIFVI